MSTQPSPPPKTWFLAQLVEVARAAGLRPTVTVNVGGLLLTGELVDGKTYFDDLTLAVQETVTDPAVARKLTDLLGEYGNRENRPSPSPPPGEPPHIHLRAARAIDINGTSLPASGGASWRVQLNAVQAFSLDLLATAAPRTEPSRSAASRS